MCIYQFKVPNRGFVQHQKCIRIPHPETADVVHLVPQGLLHVMQHRSGGAYGGIESLTAEPFQRLYLKMPDQQIGGRIVFEHPVIIRRGYRGHGMGFRRPVPFPGFRQQQFGGTRSPQTVQKRFDPVRFLHPEIPG